VVRGRQASQSFTLSGRERRLTASPKQGYRRVRAEGGRSERRLAVQFFQYGRNSSPERIEIEKRQSITFDCS
jgi:hypothetical protein